MLPSLLPCAAPDSRLILVGNVGGNTATVPLNIRRLVDDKAAYATRIYNSEREAWEAGGTQCGADISTIALTVETDGYRLIELREEHFEADHQRAGVRA